MAINVSVHWEKLRLKERRTCQIVSSDRDQEYGATSHPSNWMLDWSSNEQHTPRAFPEIELWPW